MAQQLQGVATETRVRDDQPRVVAVCCVRRERHPCQSIYNRICEVEWGMGDSAVPVGRSALGKREVPAAHAPLSELRAGNGRGADRAVCRRTLLQSDAPATTTANEVLNEVAGRTGLKLCRIAAPYWRYLIEVLCRWVVKKMARHPEARRRTYAERDGRAFAAAFDGSKAKRELGWAPTRNRRVLNLGGIHAPIDKWFEVESANRVSKEIDRASPRTIEA